MTTTDVEPNNAPNQSTIRRNYWLKIYLDAGPKRQLVRLSRMPDAPVKRTFIAWNKKYDWAAIAHAHDKSQRTRTKLTKALELLEDHGLLNYEANDGDDKHQTILKLTAAKHYFANNGNPTKACIAAGITIQQFKEWEKHDPEFKRLLSVTKQCMIDEMEESLFKRAKTDNRAHVIWASHNDPKYQDLGNAAIDPDTTLPKPPAKGKGLSDHDLQPHIDIGTLLLAVTIQGPESAPTGNNTTPQLLHTTPTDSPTERLPSP